MEREVRLGRADGVCSRLEAVQHEVGVALQQPRVLGARGFALAAVAQDDRLRAGGHRAHLAGRREPGPPAAEEAAPVDLVEDRLPVREPQLTVGGPVRGQRRFGVGEEPHRTRLRSGCGPLSPTATRIARAAPTTPAQAIPSQRPKPPCAASVPVLRKCSQVRGQDT